MDENQTQEVAPLDTNEEIAELKNRIAATDRKNKELLEEKKRYQKIEKSLSSAGEGTDVESLIEFKRKAEQSELEAKGQYTEARTKLEDQFRKATKDKDARIAELENKIKELELVAPALRALGEVVHDTDYALEKLGRDRIEVDPDGTVVYVDGYERKPIAEAAKAKLADFVLKQPKPQGSGAPSSRGSGGGVPAGTVNPFLPETFNLTEQGRLYLRDRTLYDQLKTAAGR